MKKPFWRKFFKKRKKKVQTGLEVYKEPKARKTAPDHWEPPFTTNKMLFPNTTCQNLTISDKSKDFNLGKVTATVGIMLQISMDYPFQFFVDECLERFQKFDWGGITEGEKLLCERRLRASKGSICGVYTELGSGVQIWIETSLEEGITRICLSEER